MTRLLLLSNSTSFGAAYLDHAVAAILETLGPSRSLLFVPYALHDREAYVAKVRARLGREGVLISGLEEGTGAAAQVAGAEAILVGGGNTFRLLDALQRGGLVDPIRRRVLAGAPYIGSSAGTNIAAPTIRTTNDMPIVEPRSLGALGLVPFQINPHYVDADPSSRHMGETREERIREFLEENATPVVGLREGAWLCVEGARATLGGAAGARVFERGRAPVELAPGADLSRLLASGP